MTLRSVNDTVYGVAGTVGKITGLASPHYQTIFTTLSSGDTNAINAGSYEFLFTSGPNTNYYQNKWSNVAVVFDTIQDYKYQAAPNNTITLNPDKWYVVNFEDKGYHDTRAIFMELSDRPAFITAVTQMPDTSAVPAGQTVAVIIDLSSTPPIEQAFVVRYTLDKWASSDTVMCTVSGNKAVGTLPAINVGDTLSYYVFSSTYFALLNLSNPSSDDYDLVTINFDNNGGKNYTYTVHQTTGLAARSKGEVIIYPNPADNVVTIANARGADLEITDLQGRLIRQIVNLPENAQVSVYDLEPGVYLFNINKGDRILTRKVSVR